MVRGAVKSLFNLIGEFLKTPDKTILHEDMVPSEILYAMGLNGWIGEIMAMFLPFLSTTRNNDYIDMAENSNVAADTCSLPKSAIGMTLSDHMPSPVAIISTNMPCDGGMTSYTVIEEHLKVPAYKLDIPHDFKSPRARKYFTGELKRMIEFLEKNTPGKT